MSDLLTISLVSLFWGLVALVILVGGKDEETNE